MRRYMPLLVVAAGAFVSAFQPTQTHLAFQQNQRHVTKKSPSTIPCTWPPLDSCVTHSCLQMISSASSDEGKVDTHALGKYAAAIGLQLGTIAATFKLLDFGIEAVSVPLPAISLLFYVMSLRSRIFSPLNNRRPNLKQVTSGGKTQGFRDRVMPSWTPPGVFFPVMWILIISPLRAYSSTLIFEANGGHLCDPTILALMLHLTVGDTWNTINNVERRMGASVIGVFCVLLSALFVSYKYYQVVPIAGKLLGLTCLWLATASALITDTWRLNPLEGGKRDKLYPVVGNSTTKFVFESEI